MSAFSPAPRTGRRNLLVAAGLLCVIAAMGTLVYYAVPLYRLFCQVAYTTFSEWLNTTVRGAWAYSDLMPVIPPIEAGLSPILQWVLIPLAAFWWTRWPITGVEQRIEAHS